MGTLPTIEIASLGMWDSLILMVMALVVFGPRRLPEIGRQIGKLMYEFRKASNDFKYQMEEELRQTEEADRRKKEEERLRELAASAPALTLSAAPEAASAEAIPGTEQAPYPSPYPNEDVYPAQIALTEQPPAAETPAGEVNPAPAPPVRKISDRLAQEATVERPWNQSLLKPLPP
jgi:sec-independent protein translocase protein TatB